MIKFVLLAVAFLWTVSTVVSMIMYSRNMLGPTPVYLPILFAFLSFIGGAASIGLAYFWKVDVLASILTMPIKG